jgi:hypothetical protein
MVEAAPLFSSDIYGLIRWGNLAFYNNCWGRVYLEHGESASCAISYNPAVSLGEWRWSWPQERVTELKGYPSLIIGDKVYPPIGFDQTTDPRFPLHLPSMQSLWVAGEINVNGAGAYDFAYDMAFLESSASRPENMRSEIMIWLARSTECPAQKMGEYTIDGFTYDLHINTVWNPDSPYLAFVLRGDALPWRIPLHEFIRIGIEEGYVDPGAWLAAVELGPEIWWGEGEASVRGFELTLNGE